MTTEVWISIRGQISEATHIALQEALEKDNKKDTPSFGKEDLEEIHRSGTEAGLLGIYNFPGSVYDGTFASLQNSIGKEIWTDQPNTRTIRRIYKFDTFETDPPLYQIGGNWMTESQFTWGRTEPKWHRAFEFRRNNKVRRTTPKGPVFAVELDTNDYLTLQGGIKARIFAGQSHQTDQSSTKRTTVQHT